MTLEAVPDPPAVDVSRWLPDGDIRARCVDCAWKKRGSGSQTAAARRHVEQHPGHLVQVERSQWKRVGPPRASEPTPYDADPS